MSPSFDAGLQPEPCSACGERVLKARGGCPVCRARAAAPGAARPVVGPLPSAPFAPERWPARPDPDGVALAPPPARLGALLAALGPLGERSPLPPRPLWLRDGWLALEDPPGAPPAPGLPLAAWLGVAADLARLDADLRDLELVWPLLAGDLRLDPEGGLRVAPAALPRLEPALGHDRRADAAAWGALLAELLGVPRLPGGFALEEGGAPPALLGMLRAALRGQAAPLELLGAALGQEPRRGPRPALEARAAAARAGAVATLAPGGGQGPLLLLTRAAAPPGEVAWLALDLGLDAVVRLEHPDHVDVDPTAVQARRQAFRAARGAPLLEVPALDPALRAARAPALRRGEPVALVPCRLGSDPAPAWPQVPAAPQVAARPTPGGLELQVLAAPGADAVLVVRGREGEPLLGPEDGQLLRALEPGALPAAVQDPAPSPGARWAVFALAGGRSGPPTRPAAASLEVQSLRAEPRIGAIHLTWEAPPGLPVLLRAGPSPLQGPADGEALVWARERRELLHDCLEAEQEVHYRAAVLGPDGVLSPGITASAVAFGPPPGLGEVRASSGVGRVVLAWTWPAGRSWDRVRVRREPGWPGGEREVARGEEPVLVDAEAPVGRRARYRLRAALGAHQSHLESEAAGTALAEVAALRASPAGGAVALELELPAGLPPGWELRLVRNQEREPRDARDGTALEVGPELRLLDGPLPPGRTAFYRACLVLDGCPSPGVLAQAVPAEPAGALGEVRVEGQQGRIAVRWTPPAERCERVLVLAAPEGEPLREVPAPAPGGPLELEATPGVAWRVRLVPVHQGIPDAAQAVERAATAWDDLTDLRAESAPDGVLLRWHPPAGPPAGYLLRHRPKGGSDPWSEVRLPGAAPGEHLLAGLPPRRAYQLELLCLWGPAGHETRTAPHAAEATALALPPALGDPELSLAPGEVRARFLPAPASERLHWERTVLYLGSVPPGRVRAALAGREWFREDEAAGLGLAEAAARPRGKQRETLSAAAPPGVGTALLASANGPLRRVLALGPALAVDAAAFQLASEPAGAAPAVRWARPAWLRDPVRLVRLALKRGLEEAAVEGLPPAELEELSAPLQRELPLDATAFTDEEALPYVAWGYQLEATLEVDGARATVQGPRRVVPALKGGTLRPVPEQARGFLGKKQLVTVRFEAGPPAPRAWPAFELVRCLGDQKEGRVVGKHAGGGAPAPIEDADLGAFTKGTRLTYRVRLVSGRDRLGWGEGAGSLVMG